MAHFGNISIHELTFKFFTSIKLVKYEFQKINSTIINVSYSVQGTEPLYIHAKNGMILSEICTSFIYSFTGSNFSCSNDGNQITLTGGKPANCTLNIDLGSNLTNYIASFDCKVLCYAGGSVSNQVNRFGIHFGNVQFQRDVGSVSNYSGNPFPYNSWFHVELHRENNIVYAVINNIKSSEVTISSDFTNKFLVRKWSDGSLYNAGYIYLKNIKLENSAF